MCSWGSRYVTSGESRMMNPGWGRFLRLVSWSSPIMNAAYVIARYPLPLSLRALPVMTMSSAVVSKTPLSSSGNDHARNSPSTLVAMLGSTMARSAFVVASRLAWTSVTCVWRSVCSVDSWFIVPDRSACRDWIFSASARHALVNSSSFSCVMSWSCWCCGSAPQIGQGPSW